MGGFGDTKRGVGMSRTTAKAIGSLRCGCCPYSSIPGGLERNQKLASITGKNQSVPDGLKKQAYQGDRAFIMRIEAVLGIRN